MALSVTTLIDQIRRLTDPTHPNHAYPETRVAAISAWRDVYDTYAAVAKDRSDDVVSSKNPAGFAAALTSGWQSSWMIGVAVSTFVSALTAYWTGGAFAVGSLISGTGSSPCVNAGSGTKVFAVEQTSVVTVSSFSPSYNDIYAVFRNLTEDGYQKAADLAAAFHSGTTNNVTVLITGLDTTPPPTGPLPVTNTCKVF
jgi:hypothetical protein